MDRFNISHSLLRINFVIRIYQRFDTETTVGIRNSTQDGKRLLFLDYDNILFEEHLIPELKYLQKKYLLSDFYIFKSSQKIGNYHVICLDKLKAREWMSIIEETNVDNNYKNVPVIVDNKAWVLRFLPKRASKKPLLIKILKSSYNKRNKSLAHALFLKYNYNISIEHIKKLDKNTDVTITTYETLNYIKYEEK